MSDIKVSPKHGLNPCIPVCMFCKEPKNEVALLGKLKDDVEAPKYAILDYEPCDECRKMWDKGIALIRVQTTPPEDNMPPITNREGIDFYTDGQCLVITQDAMKRMSGKELPLGTATFVSDEVFDNLVSNISNEN